jgi:pyridoxal phosphate enzyme (YggS family)
VNAGWPDFRARLDEVRRRIAAAAARAGRDPDSVVLVGVAKTVAAARLRDAVAEGLADIGENRVQEAVGHVALVGRDKARWHMIGHLQRNKAARAAELFDRIHSVDSEALAATLSRHAEAIGRRLPVLIEVNVSGEATKFGAAPGEVEALSAAVAGMPGLVLEGLMTVGAPVERPEAARPGFAKLRWLRERAEQVLGRRLPELSMGMSSDFEVAVEEGATLVRVGSALFGPRET